MTPSSFFLTSQLSEEDRLLVHTKTKIVSDDVYYNQLNNDRENLNLKIIDEFSIHGHHNGKPIFQIKRLNRPNLIFDLRELDKILLISDENWYVSCTVELPTLCDSVYPRVNTKCIIRRCKTSDIDYLRIYLPDTADVLGYEDEMINYGEEKSN